MSDVFSDDDRRLLREMRRTTGSSWYPSPTDCEAIYEQAMDEGATPQQAQEEALRFSITSYRTDNAGGNRG